MPIREPDQEPQETFADNQYLDALYPDKVYIINMKLLNNDDTKLVSRTDMRCRPPGPDSTRQEINRRCDQASSNGRFDWRQKYMIEQMLERCVGKMRCTAFCIRSVHRMQVIYCDQQRHYLKSDQTAEPC